MDSAFFQNTGNYLWTKVTGNLKSLKLNHIKPFYKPFLALVLKIYSFSKK